MRRRSTRTGRAALVVVLLGALVAACGDDDGSASLPDCADDLPVPPSLEVVDASTGDAGDGRDTCVVTLAGDQPLDTTVEAWERSLDADGWDHAVQAGAGRSTLIRLGPPSCGVVMVFAPGTERVSAEVPAERTPSLVSLLPCDVLPEEAPAG